MENKDIKAVYFVGAGGIGMSATNKGLDYVNKGLDKVPELINDTKALPI